MKTRNLDEINPMALWQTKPLLKTLHINLDLSAKLLTFLYIFKSKFLVI